MDNTTPSRKFVWFFAAIGILAVLVIVVVALVVPKKSKAPTDQAKNPAVPVFKPTVTKVADDKLPDKFPADIPVEAKAKVVDNYNATTDSGTVQATREYESTKTPEQNYGIYNDFFKKGNWQILTSSNTPDDRSITVKKDRTVIQALFYQNSATKASVVRVNVTVLAPTK